ncbi:hypothetical protein WJX77_002739 [Trebouxia sp. C0004]
MHRTIWQSASSLLGFTANHGSLFNKACAHEESGVQPITGSPVHTVQVQARAASTATSAHSLSMQAKLSKEKADACLRHMNAQQGGAVHALGFQKELNGVLRQLQQRDEQLQQKAASLVAAVQRCYCLMSDLALFQAKLQSRGESLASAKHQLLRMGTLLLHYKKAWELSHQQNQEVWGQLARFSAALQNKGAMMTCYAPGASIQSLQSSPIPREPSPEPRECLHAEFAGVSPAAATSSRPVASSVQHAAAAEPSSSPGHLVHTTELAAARLPCQRAASGPAVPKSLSRFSSSSASQSKPAFASSRNHYDVAVVQQSVSLMQQISRTPLHPTQSMSGPSQAVQPLIGYTMGAQPNMLGAYLATRICLASIL